MAYQNVFKRYELKYRITPAQKERLLLVMAPYMELDAYGRAGIYNIYYDTPDYRLIRASIEKPPYKEKLRVRSYGKGVVYVELKKKYKKVVYKRRLVMGEEAAETFLSGGAPPDNQIGREIAYFLRFYGNLGPRLYLAYTREAYYCKAGGDLRITFDDDIRCRGEELRFSAGDHGERVPTGGDVLMEIKTSEGMPLWLTEVLTKERIYKTSFSKYGTAYRELIFPRLKGENKYVGTIISGAL